MYHHVMLRGIDGTFLFGDDEDRSRFCLLLQEAAEIHHHRVHAFCLMGNHIHLMLEPTTSHEPLAACVHAFAFRYAQHFNKRYKRRGYLYQGRFRSILVEDGLYLRRLTRYIHLNPVEAGLVAKPGNYRWSSHNAYFGHDTFVWLETDHVLARFGNKRLEALTNLAEYTSMKSEAEVDIEAIRKATRIGVFGSDEFVHIYAPEILKSEDVDRIEVDICKSFDNAIKTVCNHYDITTEELQGEGKTTSLVDARSILAYACRLIPGSSLGEACRKLGKHHGTMSKLAKRVENRPSLLEVTRLLLTSSQSNLPKEIL